VSVAHAFARVAVALDGSLAILDAGDLDPLRTAIGGRIP
jgi:hypothetical protein